MRGGRPARSRRCRRRRSGTAPEHPRALRRSPKGGRPRYTAGPRRRGKPKHSHRGHPVPGPGNVAAKRVRERKTRVLRACRVPNPAKRLNVVQRPKTLFEPQTINDFVKLGTALGGTPTIVERLPRRVRRTRTIAGFTPDVGPSHRGRGRP